MPLNPAMVQMVLGLGQLSLARQEHHLREKEYDQNVAAFKEQVAQFQRLTGDKEAADALLNIMKFTPEQQKAYIQLLKSDTGKYNPDFINALQQVGQGSMFSQGVNAIRSLGGQAPQTEGQSDVTRTLNTGQTPTQAAPPSGGMPQPGANPGGTGGWNMSQLSPWQQMAANYVAATSQGYTPEQQQVSQYGAVTGRIGSTAQMANAQTQHDQMLGELGIKAILAKTPGQLTAADASELYRSFGQLLNDMKNPQSGAADNQARMQVFNDIAHMLQINGYPAPGYFGGGPTAAPQIQSPSMQPPTGGAAPDQTIQGTAPWAPQQLPSIGDPNSFMRILMNRNGPMSPSQPMPFNPNNPVGFPR